MNMKMIILQIFLIAVICLGDLCGRKTIASRFTYYLDGDSVDWTSRDMKKMYAVSGRYVPGNVIPTRFQTRGFEAVITFPRLRRGVPITLGKIQLKFGQSKPEIKPFPSWKLQEEGSCDGIQNAVDVYLDALNILWVLDIGATNTLELPYKRCRPKIWGIHYRTGKILHEIDLSHLCYPSSRLQYIIADYAPNGKGYLYVSDAESASILVCDIAEKRSTRVQLPVYSMNDRAKDILYIFLIRPKRGDHIVGFTFLSGRSMYFVRTSALQNGDCGSVINLGVKPSEIVPLGTDNGEILYFRYKTSPEIFMWDVNKPFVTSNFFLVDRGNECRLSTQVSGGSRLLMWSLDSNFQDFINGMCGSVGASAIIRPLVSNEKR